MRLTLQMCLKSSPVTLQMCLKSSPWGLQGTLKGKTLGLMRFKETPRYQQNGNPGATVTECGATAGLINSFSDTLYSRNGVTARS